MVPKHVVVMFSLALIAMLTLMQPKSLTAGDASKALQKSLEARYRHRKVKVVPPRIVIGLYDRSGGNDSDFSVHYDHFYSSLPLPTKYQKRDNLDDRTTEEVTAQAQYIDQMEAGETLEVIEAALWRRSRDFWALDLMLRSLSGKRLATRTTLSRGGNYYTDKAAFGVHFRFAFPPDVIEAGDYNAVIQEVNKYLLPVDEYQQATEKAKTVELQPGMAQDEVQKLLGQPDKTVVFGKRTILKYKDMTVELEDNKVVEVKAN